MSFVAMLVVVAMTLMPVFVVMSIIVTVFIMVFVIMAVFVVTIFIMVISTVVVGQVLGQAVDLYVAQAGPNEILF